MAEMPATEADARELIKSPFMNPKRAQRAFQVSVSKLEKDRAAGRGAPFLKLGGRVLYLDPTVFGETALGVFSAPTSSAPME